MASIDTKGLFGLFSTKFETLKHLSYFSASEILGLKIKPSGSDKFSQQATDCAFES